MFEDTQVVIRSCKSKKDGHCNDQKGQTMIYKILYRKLKIEQHESHYKLWPNSDPPKGYIYVGSSCSTRNALGE